MRILAGQPSAAMAGRRRAPRMRHQQPTVTPKHVQARANRMGRYLFAAAGSIALVVAAIAWIGPVEFLREVVMLLAEDTKYAAGFSPRAFDAVAIGDSEASVVAALGAPLREDADEPHCLWLYAPSAHPDFEDSGDLPDARCSFTRIRFGEDGGVDGVWGQMAHGSQGGIGSQSTVLFGDGFNTLGITNAAIEALKARRATKAQIQEQYGPPRHVFEARAVRWLVYSFSPGSGHYRQRMIGIDREGKVCRKVRRIYWD